MKRLRSCEGCRRHVFVTERACPFCQIELSPAPERAQLPVPSTASRAQRLALAAALGSQGLLAACAQTSGGDDGQTVTPVYGAPLAGQQAPAAGRSGEIDGGFSTPVYGAPVAGSPAPRPPDAGALDEDAGVDEGGAGSSGAGAGGGGHGGTVAPVYGAPIPEYGAPPPPPPED